MMMAQIINRRQLKTEMKDLLRTAQVSAVGMTALYMGITALLDLADIAAGGQAALGLGSLMSTFVSVLTALVGMVLSAGFVLYCMAIRRGERAEYLTLFDGFSFVGKVIGLNIVITVFTSLWTMLFIIPGFIATYRYRFALYNLYENPGIGIMEALDMSKRQTVGYTSQLFLLDMSYLGWSLLSSVPLLVLEGVVLIEMPQGMPDLAWTLIIDLWALVVSLFYLPVYQCTELGYFDIAKSTSGVGFGVEPPRQDGWTGPDDLGGWY